MPHVLTRVDITNYRGFRTFQMSGVATVNLIVGKNNSGKTALLESIHFLASGGDPAVLTGAANRRGELVLGEPTFTDISHFFYGHDIPPGSEFSISAGNGLPPVRVKAVPLEEEEITSEMFEFARTRRPALALKIEGGRPARHPRTFVLSEEGALLVDSRRPSRAFFEERREGPPIVFISPDAGASESLGTMWNLVLRDKREGDVKQAMQILEKNLEDIVFQTSDPTSRQYRFPEHYYSRSAVLISFIGDKRRVPLGSMGDGMRRLLALSLSLIQAQEGYLFIDEIDTGFHYSIMAKMWELVVRTANESNTQVFATTHSADCVRGLGVLCKQAPELQDKVAAHKIEQDLEKSVLFTGADVLDALEQDIEIR